MSVHKLRILLTFCTLAFLLTASRPLICWRIGPDLQWKRARCWSTEFHALAPNEEPAPYTPEPTATPEPWTPEPTDVPTATPTEAWVPSPTFSYPYPQPTFEVTPYPMYKWVE